MIDVVKQIQSVDNEIVKPDVRIEGWQIVKAPQAALTTVDNSAFSGSYDAAAIAIHNNMRTRINELESKLKTLNLLK